jgi:predicted nucleic acid-binding Zn ribbon protein
MDHNVNSIGDLIKIFLKKNKMYDKYEEVDLLSNWENIVGPVIASHTIDLELRGSRLVVKLNSAALRHTLAFSKTEFQEKINTALGRELVKELILR